MRVAVSVSIMSSVLYLLAFPPADLPEGACVFAVPMILWAFSKPSFKTFALASFLSGWVSWMVLLFWLRYVTWFGLISLSFLMACFYASWFILVRWVGPGIGSKSSAGRIMTLLGLASGWVLLEWLRSTAFSGFPWLVLAASQWQRPPMLSFASWSGAWGVSFMLIFFNLALAVFLKTAYQRKKEKSVGISFMGAFPPEMFIALGSLVFSLLLYLQNAQTHKDRDDVMSIGIVQPAIPATDKWDLAIDKENMSRIMAESRQINIKEPDIILWPETATPYPVLGNEGMKNWTEQGVRALGCPLVFGSIAKEDIYWYNGMFLVYPDKGLQKKYYSKRHLVPFGEYIPLNEYLTFLNKIVPLEGEFSPRSSAEPISLDVAGKSWMVGGLICFEDIFPDLARDTVKAGADILFVVTNNAWFGQEGGAYQHAAHSVLRAVETGRPVVRCGNEGWSGWIDELGVIRNILEDDKGSIYFQGSDLFEITRSSNSRAENFYIEHGDWFLYLCGVLFVVLILYGCNRKEEAAES